MSDFKKIDTNEAEVCIGKKLDEVIENDPDLKNVLNDMPKPNEEELTDIFTNEDGKIDDGMSDSSEEFNPEDFGGLEELQNLFSMFGNGDVNNLLEKPQLIFQKIDPTAILPEYAHPGDAGMDICSIENVTIQSMQRKLIHTGLRVRIPENFEIQVRPRSGLALKHGVTVLNTPGTIDSGYRGEIGIILANFGDKEFTVRKGDRIAQLVFAMVSTARVLEGDVDKETERGEGGFGSTGVTTEQKKEEVTNAEDSSESSCEEHNV